MFLITSFTVFYRFRFNRCKAPFRAGCCQTTSFTYENCCFFDCYHAKPQLVIPFLRCVPEHCFTCDSCVVWCDAMNIHWFYLRFLYLSMNFYDKHDVFYLWFCSFLLFAHEQPLVLLVTLVFVDVC